MPNFMYDSSVISELERSLSASRLSTYLAGAKGNKEDALKLYLWNSEISSAFYPALQGLEIALRNAMHILLSSHFSGEDWYDRVSLDRKDQDRVQEAKGRVYQIHGVINPPHVIAELSFGFWVSLMSRKYQPLWQQALWQFIPIRRLARVATHAIFDDIKNLRNRIFHYEPIFNYDLADQYEKILDALDRINPIKANWIRAHFAITDILNRKPI